MVTHLGLGPTEIWIILAVVLLKLALPLGVVLLVLWLVRRQRQQSAPRG